MTARVFEWIQFDKSWRNHKWLPWKSFFVGLSWSYRALKEITRSSVETKVTTTSMDWEVLATARRFFATPFNDLVKQIDPLFPRLNYLTLLNPKQGSLTNVVWLTFPEKSSFHWMIRHPFTIALLTTILFWAKLSG